MRQGPTSLDIRATVTLEPCAVVRVAEASTITVGHRVTPGRIVAPGGDVAILIESSSATEALGAITDGTYTNPTLPPKTHANHLVISQMSNKKKLQKQLYPLQQQEEEYS